MSSIPDFDDEPDDEPGPEDPTGFYARQMEQFAASERAEEPYVNGSETKSYTNISTQDEWPQPLGPAAFHGLAGEIVRALEPHSEADPAALLLQFLVGFGNALGRGPYFQVEGDQHPANLFVVITGSSSSARKGTSWGATRRLLAAADPGWASMCIASGVSSGEGLIHAVRDSSVRTVTRRGKKQTEVDEGVDDKRLLLIESEFASVLRRLEREGNSASAILRQAWDSGDLRTLTKTMPVRATGAHISMIAHITPDELRRYLTRTESANGFANRHLFVCAKRSKALPEGGHLSDDMMVPLADQLRRALLEARKVGRLERDPEARELWASMYPGLTAERPGMLGAATSRAAAQSLRLSMLYALLDAPFRASNAYRAPTYICAQHVAAAAAVWTYCFASAGYVFGSSIGDPTADEILSALRRAPAGMTKNQIRDLFSRHVDAGDLGRALGLLHQHGLATMKEEKTGGRPAERWCACT